MIPATGRRRLEGRAPGVAARSPERSQALSDPRRRFNLGIVMRALFGQEPRGRPRAPEGHFWSSSNPSLLRPSLSPPSSTAKQQRSSSMSRLMPAEKKDFVTGLLDSPWSHEQGPFSSAAYRTMRCCNFASAQDLGVRSMSRLRKPLDLAEIVANVGCGDFSDFPCKKERSYTCASCQFKNWLSFPGAGGLLLPVRVPPRAMAA